MAAMNEHELELTMQKVDAGEALSKDEAVRMFQTVTAVTRDLMRRIGQEEQRREQFEEEVECAHMVLDERQVPRMIEGEPLSLVGRIRELRALAIEEAALLIDGAAKAASKEGDIKLKREYEYRAALMRALAAA